MREANGLRPSVSWGRTVGTAHPTRDATPRESRGKLERMSETITDAEIEHLKKLARLEMNATETAQAKAQINDILGSFQQLQSLDLEDYPEMPRPVPMVNVMREDVVRDGFSQEAAMGTAVDPQDGFFKVPRTVE